METFGVISQWDLVENTLTCRGSFQTPSYMAMGRAATFRLPSNKVRFIGQPHGGSFGGKGGGRGTDITAMLSRKASGRPVKWIEDRIEYLTAGGSQAWDRHYEVSIAVKNDGTVTALRVKLLDDMGATAEGFGATGAAKPMASFTGCYAIPVAEYDMTLVATNKLPASPYRGMGVSVLGSGFRVSGQRPRPMHPPPELGRDADAILAELGYSDDDISALRRKGIV